ncbi:polyserase-related [Holotrichia oblita]|uniref:Polyserase-related n=1 Tax=Holotrichia oblita TaxID=644536 RepID=A0ACB9SYJ7_HOLOL|nr:polyserase-related [Holotrichia oblita]
MFATILGDSTNVPLLDGRIVGGSPVTIQDYPYQVSLQLLGSHTCGGAIISDRYVITAAHCFTIWPTSWHTIRAGSSFHNSGGQVVGVNAIYNHPNFNRANLDYDISILHLSSSLSFGPAAAPIPLSTQNQYYSDDTPAVVSGWGALIENGTAPLQLQAVGVPIVNNARCEALYKVEEYDVTDSMLCAGYMSGGRDACQGDSGGPLVINGQLIGIVSWCEGCARTNFPGVYASFTRSELRFKDLSSLDGRIVGGQPVAIEEHPYQVSVQLLGGHRCGGSIISDIYIVSAAHCYLIWPDSWHSVRVGATYHNTGGEVIAVNTINNHPRYNPDTYEFDISIISLVSPLTFGAAVAIVALPTQGQYIPEGAQAIVTGWGAMVENGTAPVVQLQAVSVPVISNERCHVFYQAVGDNITDSMLCAGYTVGGRDACQGDSGGPLTANGQLIGIVSWGEGCARANFPGVYASVPYLRYFITQITGI